MGISLTLAVLPERRGRINNQALWEQNEQWAKDTAWAIIHRRVRIYPHLKEDWHSEALLHLWHRREQYDTSRGANNWRGWAYNVLQNKVGDLVDHERTKSRPVDIDSPAVVRAIPSAEPPSIDSAMVDSLKARLIVMAREALSRDLKALDYLAMAGEEYRAHSHVREMLGVDADTAKESIGRIRAAAVAVGLGEVQ